MSAFVAVSFASVSANSFPWIPAWALTQHNWIFHFISPISATFLLITSMKCVWMLLFLRESSVIRLSVCMVAVLSSVSMFSVNSSVLKIASCSAWLLVVGRLTCISDHYWGYLIWIWLKCTKWGFFRHCGLSRPYPNEFFHSSPEAPHTKRQERPLPAKEGIYTKELASSQ